MFELNENTVSRFRTHSISIPLHLISFKTLNLDTEFTIGLWRCADSSATVTASWRVYCRMRSEATHWLPWYAVWHQFQSVKPSPHFGYKFASSLLSLLVTEGIKRASLCPVAPTPPPWVESLILINTHCTNLITMPLHSYQHHTIHHYKPQKMAICYDMTYYDAVILCVPLSISCHLHIDIAQLKTT